MAADDSLIRVVTWNVFHLMDEGLHRPGLRAGLRRGPTPAGDLVHLNRKHLGPAAMVLRRTGADLCLLQEVPPSAVEPLGRAVGARAAWSTHTGPFVGPAWLRDRIGRWNPALMGTHEGNANAVMVGDRLGVVGGSAQSLRLNPWRQMFEAWRDPALDLSWGGLWKWLGEARFAVAGRVVAPGGTPVTVVGLHLHNARGEAERGLEVGRLVDALDGVDGPLIVGGDFNIGPESPHLARLAEVGLEDHAGDPAPGIDRIYTRGVEVVEPARRLPPWFREFDWRGRGGTGRVRISDHDPVVMTVRVPGGGAPPSGGVEVQLGHEDHKPGDGEERGQAPQAG